MMSKNVFFSASIIARIKAGVRFSATILAMMLAGCSSSTPDAALRPDRLFCDEAVCTSESVADYDALVFQSDGDDAAGDL